MDKTKDEYKFKAEGEEGGSLLFATVTMTRIEERCFQQIHGRKLTIRRAELDDWKILVEVHITYFLVDSTYTLLGEPQRYAKRVRFRSRRPVGEVRIIKYFFIDSAIFIHLPERCDENSWVFFVTPQGIEVEGLSKSCYKAFAKQNDLEAVHEKETKRTVAEMQNSTLEKQKHIDTIPFNQLSQLRNDTHTDFVIESNDGKSVCVHKLVMNTYWPFFKTMMENTCKESVEDTLKLEYSSDVVELLVAYLYGQRFDCNFNQAFALLELAGVYQLPTLADEAFRQVKSSDTPLELHDCINGWKSARMGQHEEAKTFFTRLIVAKAKPILKKKSVEAEFESVTQDETMELLFDCLSVD